MRILATFPGRYGDLLWALPTIRALSRRIGAPIDLQICGEFASILPLLQQQPYLGTLYADTSWSLTPPDEWRPPTVAAGPRDQVYHLGYRGWPQRPLPFEVLDNLNSYAEGPADCAHCRIAEAELDLQTPWITVPPRTTWKPAWACSWTECHFELKHGLYNLLCLYLPGGGVDEEGEEMKYLRPRHAWEHGPSPVAYCNGARWQQEAGFAPSTWEEMAELFQRAPLVLTDCSAPHVLAVAVGTPVVMVEPMEARHNPIFFPLGTTGPQVTLVTGSDGLPTVDARHTADAITAAIAAQKDQR